MEFDDRDSTLPIRYSDFGTSVASVPFESGASCLHGPGDPPVIRGDGKGVTAPRVPSDGDERVEVGDSDPMVVSEGDKVDRKLGVPVGVQEFRVECFAFASMADELACIAPIRANRGANSSVCSRRFPCEGVCFWGGAGQLGAGVIDDAPSRDES